MTIPTFPVIQPDYSIERQVAIQSVDQKLGDGYLYRVRFGFHPVKETYRVKFDLVNEDVPAISNFLEARAYDGFAFFWGGPESYVDRKGLVDSWLDFDFYGGIWNCVSWPIKRDGPIRSTIEVQLDRQWSHMVEEWT